MKQRRRIGSMLWSLIFAAACGGKNDPVTVAFTIADTECQEEIEACGIDEQTQGIVAEAFDPAAGELAEDTGDRVLYADFPAPGGGLAILEISQPEVGPARVRYREVFRGEVSFAGEIIEQDVALVFGEESEPMLHGQFEFTAVDTDRNTRRRIHSGRVLGVGETIAPPVGGGVHVPRPTEVPPVQSSTPTPARDPSPRPDRDVDVAVVVVESAHGCSEALDDNSGCEDSSSSSGGGCDSGSSGGGCEADGLDSGGCDSASSSGCEADSFDTGGCDNCSAGPRPPRRSVWGAIWRLFWPVLLVGAANRRMRHQRT